MKNEFIVRIAPAYINTLEQYGEITFKSTIIKSLVALKTNLTIDEVWNIPHVFKVEENRTGEYV